MALLSTAAAAQVRELPASLGEVVKTVEPSVVKIDTVGKQAAVNVRDDGVGGGSPNSIDEGLRESLRRQRRSGAVGSGFILDKSGLILTNLHVLEDASKISVQLSTGEEFPARLVGSDEETDLAVIKIDAGRDLPVLKTGDSDRAKVGDWVLAFGSPFGFAQSVTAGIVSQVKRETVETYSFPKKYIQTDAAINRGNSGGPLVNLDGEAIGVNSIIATANAGGGSSGIGFALPINDAVAVFRQIVEDGKVRRGYLGVSLDSVKTEFARIYGLPDARGAIVLNVSDPKGSAAAAGIQAGDVIVEFNGQRINDAGDLIAKVSATAPERFVNVAYLREAGAKIEKRTAQVKLAERPSNNKIIDDEKPRLLGTRPAGKPFGLTLQEPTPLLIDAYKLGDKRGLLVKEIDPTSQVFDLRTQNGDPALIEGDLIQRINRTDVVDVRSFNEIVARLKSGDAVVLQVLSNNRSGRGLQMKILQFTVQ